MAKTRMDVTGFGARSGSSTFQQWRERNAQPAPTIDANASFGRRAMQRRQQSGALDIGLGAGIGMPMAADGTGAPPGFRFGPGRSDGIVPAMGGTPEWLLRIRERQEQAQGDQMNQSQSQHAIGNLLALAEQMRSGMVPQARQGGRFAPGQPVEVHDDELVYTNPDGTLEVIPSEDVQAMRRAPRGIVRFSAMQEGGGGQQSQGDGLAQDERLELATMTQESDDRVNSAVREGTTRMDRRRAISENSLSGGVPAPGAADVIGQFEEGVPPFRFLDSAPPSARAEVRRRIAAGERPWVEQNQPQPADPELVDAARAEMDRSQAARIQPTDAQRAATELERQDRGRESLTNRRLARAQRRQQILSDEHGVNMPVGDATDPRSAQQIDQQMSDELMFQRAREDRIARDRGMSRGELRETQRAEQMEEQLIGAQIASMFSGDAAPQVTPQLQRSITDRAKFYEERGLDTDAAMERAMQEHGVGAQAGAGAQADFGGIPQEFVEPLQNAMTGLANVPALPRVRARKAFEDNVTSLNNVLDDVESLGEDQQRALASQLLPVIAEWTGWEIFGDSRLREMRDRLEDRIRRMANGEQRVEQTQETRADSEQRRDSWISSAPGRIAGAF